MEWNSLLRVEAGLPCCAMVAGTTEKKFTEMETRSGSVAIGVQAVQAALQLT